ncbi:MAG: acetyl-CoA C-acyltransferase [Pseudomonadota bacterium]|nr:acetyl-CoA C-acyltransferase [Gammaproteobacteria bacterium]MEC8645189.1 acetyl-CoA C-acyltransferase [Pseudomonadota bacterium]|tara:strand:+ start:108 stop:1286 length:1179 start_codon:yes stop_codon:yes gene_type:complete
MNETVYIVNGARTPMGGLQGCFSSISAVELGSAAIEETLNRSCIEKKEVQEVIMGCVLPGGLRQGPARQAAIQAGIPVETGASTINKLCGSGMKATMLGFDSIKAGSNQLVITGGMESMSNAPYLLPKARQGLRMGHGEIQDSMFTDGLEDASSARLMGSFAQEVADEYQLTRESMDEFAIASLSKAKAAIENQSLAPEIVPITVKTRQGQKVINEDEQPGNAQIDKIPKLKPAFKDGGTVTAANSSSISDGASAMLLASETAVKTFSLNPMAKICAHSTNSMEPSKFTLAPIGAIENILEITGWDKSEVDLFEINEAFAMVTMLATKELDLDPSKVNIHGGACAQGHPIGSTGSRIIISLMYALKKTGGKKGIAALCIGGGEATAVALELV